MTAFNFQNIDRTQAPIALSPRLMIARMVHVHSDILDVLDGAHTYRILPQFVGKNGHTPDFAEGDLKADPLRFGYDSYVISRGLRATPVGKKYEDGTTFRMSLKLFVSAEEKTKPCASIRLEIVDAKGEVIKAKSYSAFTLFGFLMAKFTEDAFNFGLTRNEITQAAAFIGQAQVVCNSLNRATEGNLTGQM